MVMYSLPLLQTFQHILNNNESVKKIIMGQKPST